MLILQECCADEVCWLVVYAPIDVAAMSGILNGGDPDSVALLPSGFAILPDAETGTGSGSLLTLAFQILVDHVPTARLSLGSVATVNKLISNTILRLKAGLSIL
jgi:homeobox-leucine zipper protein